MPPPTDLDYMRRALELAREAERAGEVPVGALVVQGTRVLGEGWNQPIGASDPTAHAEVVAVRQAARLVGNYRLPGSTLYVTLEPCALCAGALIQARVAGVVFGAGDSRHGACGSVFDVLRNPTLNHRAEVVVGVLAEDCAELLREFFRARRAYP